MIQFQNQLMLKRAAQGGLPYPNVPNQADLSDCRLDLLDLQEFNQCLLNLVVIERSQVDLLQTALLLAEAQVRLCRVAARFGLDLDRLASAHRENEEARREQIQDEVIRQLNVPANSKAQ